MTEKQYRLQTLREKIEVFDKKKIAIYGTGKNAEAVVNEFADQNIIALIDQSNVGRYIYGKKVIDFEDARFLKLDVIIIAAEAQTERIIVNRIAKPCLDSNIRLLNMYGTDIFDAFRENILIDIDYINFCMEDLKKDIYNNGVVCFDLMGVLCESRFCNKDTLWKYIEKESGVSKFYENRLAAESQRIMYRPYDISEIYSTYLVNTFADESETKELLSLEENIFLKSIEAREKMVELLKFAVDEKKKVYIVSDLPYSGEMLRKVLEKIGINDDVILIQENIGGKTFSAGLIRTVLKDDFCKKVLYVGKTESMGYYLATSYGMKRCLIKPVMDYVHDLTEISVDLNTDDEKKDDVKSWLIKEYNSPFYQDNYEKTIDSLNVMEEQIAYKEEPLDLYEFNTSNRINDFECLSVPQHEDIAVSIIIPVYNHFDYTYACLQSIIANTVKVSYEIIIADDSSTDLTSDILKIVDGVKVVRNDKNLLFLKNCNNAAKQATGKYILFLNNDTQVRSNWLYPLFYLLETDDTIGMVGSKLLFPDGTVQEAGGLIFKDGSAANYGRGRNSKLPELNYVRDVDYISGASIMIRRDLWQEIGGFDERFAPAYCEDSDLAFEVRKHGKRVVYQPASEVVHFEGISNGTSVSEGIKKYQEINQSKLIVKWGDLLTTSQYNNCEEEKFAAKDRKQKKKTVLFISSGVPTPDRDAGSKTIVNYLKLFLKQGYIVKFWPTNMYAIQPYTFRLQQMGIEVLCGEKMKNKMGAWVMTHQRDIDYAFVNYPNAGSEVIDLLKITTIKIRYYGHDLHYLRLKREYEITKDKGCLIESDLFYEKERQLIHKSEYVYYPSDVEIDIVKSEFGKENAKQISPYMYEGKDSFGYNPEQRKGIMFIGGSHGPNEDAIVWFLSEIFPKIYKEKHIPFYIVGADRSSILKQIKMDGVVHTGYVTDDELTDLYHKIRMVVIPLRYGAGIKGKVVDAMYHGVPLISTSVGIEGIPNADECVKIADDAETFVTDVLELYDNYGKLKRMSIQYNEIISEHFSVNAAWNKIKDDFK